MLRARCQTDRRLFARYFFHERLADERTGKPIPFSPFHLSALDAPKLGYRERGPGQGWRRARMGPRGNGKTTICLRVELTHDIVYELERYVVILAESANLARARVFELAIELENNTRLRHYFGDLVGDDIWRRSQGELLTTNGVIVLAKSMESQIRGLLHPRTNARPTKIVLDDAEDSQDVLNPELRERDRRRFAEDIEGAASIDGSTCFQMTGTPLHREALLPSLRQNPAWDFQTFPAVRSWPKRMDLWERCRELWAAAGAPETEDEQDAPARVAADTVATRFYQAHRRAMDEGADVLWPEREPLLRLMLSRWTNGEAAFWKEKLLVPRDPTLATFDVDRIVRHRIEGDALYVPRHGAEPRKVKLASLRFVAFHDPAKADPTASGRRKKTRLGDFAAIVVVGIEELETGGRFGHVVAAWLERKPVSEQITAAFEMAERWHYDLIVENDTLGLLGADYRRVRKERQAAQLFWQVPIRTLDRQSIRKDARIASLEPAYTNGWLSWNAALPMEYVNQHRDHPTGDHDDGPDATEGAWRAATRKGAHLALVNLD